MERVVIDVNTQRDFLGDDGVMPVLNHQSMSDGVRRVYEWIVEAQVPVISACDAHRVGGESIRSPMFHCIDGTPGQKKMPFTLLESRLTIPHDSDPSLPLDLFERYQQVIFHKRTHDVFANPKADRLLSQLVVRDILIMGMGLEKAIKALVLGLMSRAKPVTIISDACGGWDEQACELTLRQLEAKGARLVTIEELVTGEVEVPAKVSTRQRRGTRTAR